MPEVKDGSYFFKKNFFTAEESDFFFNRLHKSVLWTQERMKLYGKEVKFPRLTAWYGDKGYSYSYSGLTLQPHPWIEELLMIKKRVEPVADETFNSVLLNLYRNESDSISWHSDDEKALGRHPIIASVNFGDTRTFHLKHNETKEKISLQLSHGSLLIMREAMQHHWKHQVPKTKKLKCPRINLTFRRIHTT